jgi:hypothetical protein
MEKITIPALLTLFGLVFNTMASIILLSSYLIITKNVSDDFVTKMDGEGNYTQRKHIKNRKIGILGFALYSVGFIFQAIGILVTL